jgi:hypothetical protein
MAKVSEQERALQDKLMADGTIVAYGEYENVVHTEGQLTHGTWFSANSEEAILKALEAFMSRPDATGPVLAASKHWDYLMTSRMNNSRPGKFTGGYLSIHSWDVKPGHSRDFRALMKAKIVPVLDKLIADGVLILYSVDYQTVHTDDPNREEVAYITADASGLDKVSKAFEAALSKDTELSPAMSTITDDGSRRDALAHLSYARIK